MDYQEIIARKSIIHEQEGIDDGYATPNQGGNAMHLRFGCMTAGIECNENRHPQVVMRELGITYQHATPQSMGDQWWFWNCDGVPQELPEYITILDLDPMECIGFGLSKEDAEKIAAGLSGT